MKNRKVFSLLAAGLTVGFMSCNNSSDNTSATDSTANTAVSSGNYAARADSVRTNVSAGNYLNPRTGKAYSNLNVDQSTGAVTDESGAPVRRYVDKRTWWVYDTNSWDTIGSARMNNGSLQYRSENGDWMDYDRRWSDDADMGTSTDTSGSGSAGGTKVADHGNKVKDADTKVKVSDKGDKLKVKKTDNKQ